MVNLRAAVLRARAGEVTVLVGSVLPAGALRASAVSNPRERRSRGQCASGARTMRTGYARRGGEIKRDFKGAPHPRSAAIV